MPDVQQITTVLVTAHFDVAILDDMNKRIAA